MEYAGFELLDRRVVIARFAPELHERDLEFLLSKLDEHQRVEAIVVATIRSFADECGYEVKVVTQPATFFDPPVSDDSRNDA